MANTVFGDEETVTITLTSLADGAYRQSASVDNSADSYIDMDIGFSIQVGTSPTADEALYLYLAPESDQDAEFSAGCSGSDSAYTADGEEGLLTLLAAVTVDATSDQDYVKGGIRVTAPRKFCFVVRNETGAALNATGSGNYLTVTPITYA